VPSFATVEQLAEHLGVRDTLDQAPMVAALAAAEDAVRGHCGRTFEVAGATATARVFAPASAITVYPDDFLEMTGVTVTDDGTAVDMTTVDGFPLNGRHNGTAWPITRLTRRSGCWASWDSCRRGDQVPSISVTARWGWPAVPAPVTSATLLIAADLYHGRDARFGVIGLDAGVVARVRVNPQAAALLDPYTLPKIGIA
jgi:hypothetical protein